jgi:hypothetical protein
MKNFTDLLDLIDEKLQTIDTDYCGGVSDPNYFTWENLEEEDLQITISWDLYDDGKVSLQVERDWEEEDSMEWDSLEEAIEDIDYILDFFSK